MVLILHHEIFTNIFDGMQEATTTTSGFGFRLRNSRRLIVIIIVIITIITIVIIVLVVVGDVIRICNGIIVFSEKGIAAMTKSVAIIVLVHAKRLNTLLLNRLHFLHTRAHSENLAPDTAFELKVKFHCDIILV